MQRGARIALVVAGVAALAYGLALVGAYVFAARDAEPGISVATLVTSILFIVLGGSLVWFLVGVGAFRATRARPVVAHAAPRREPRALPPQPVPDEAALADLKLPITACPDCGYLGVRFPGIRDGVWPGGGEIGARFVCPRCDYQGIPVEFDTREDYARFLSELAGGAASA